MWLQVGKKAAPVLPGSEGLAVCRKAPVLPGYSRFFAPGVSRGYPCDGMADSPTQFPESGSCRYRQRSRRSFVLPSGNVNMAPRPVDLEPHREWIVSHVNSGSTIEYIRFHLAAEGPAVSKNTLLRRLDAWGVRHPETGPRGERRQSRREAGLAAEKAWIIEAYDRGDTMKAIRSEIERRLGIKLPDRRLRALLHDEWDIVPRRERTDTPEVRALITEQARAGVPVSEIKQSLGTELGVHISKDYIWRKLKLWDVGPPERRGVDHIDEDQLPVIKEFIKVTFFESRQTDAQLKEHLEGRGYSVSLKNIYSLRKEMDLLRKHSSEKAEEHLEQVREALSSHQRAGILVPRLTKKMLPIFMKQEFNISVSRAMAWRFMQQQYPEEMLSRIREVARKRAGFLCPGPNYIWSIDAYCKLAHWGIEVYACIDAYSRYIIWAHVGHTAQTQRSVALQYMDTVRALDRLPLIIRSDHGVETGMIAGAHYWLSASSTEGRLLKPSRDDDGNVVWIYREVADGMEVRHVVHANPEEGVPPPTFSPLRMLEFKDCYSYGLSTKNQRIESWWQELNFHITMYWRVRLSVPLSRIDTSSAPWARDRRCSHEIDVVPTRSTLFPRDRRCSHEIDVVPVGSTSISAVLRRRHTFVSETSQPTSWTVLICSVPTQNTFATMQREQEWDQHRIADRIALLYVFLPQVHWEIGKFVRMWNGHTIRAQNNRPHVVPGIPAHNYFGEDTEARVDCSVAVNEDSLGRLEEALECDRQNVSSYLSDDIMRLCDTMMGTLDMDAIPPRDPVRPLISEYRHLRDCLQHHEGQQVSPLLYLAEKPVGGWPALEEVVQQTGRSLEDILGERIYDDFDEAIDN